MKNKVLAVQLCPTLRPNGLLLTKLLCPWNSPGKNTGLGYHVLLQGIFPTQGLNLGLPPCRQILYHLSHQGSPEGYGGLFKGFDFILRRVGSHLKQEGGMIKSFQSFSGCGVENGLEGGQEHPWGVPTDGCCSISTSDADICPRVNGSGHGGTGRPEKSLEDSPWEWVTWRTRKGKWSSLLASM